MRRAKCLIRTSSFFGEGSDRQVPNTWMYGRKLLLAGVSENTDRCGSLNHGSSLRWFRLLSGTEVSSACRSFQCNIEWDSWTQCHPSGWLWCSNVSKISLLAGVLETQKNAVLWIRSLPCGNLVCSESPKEPLLAEGLEVIKGMDHWVG
jgi:hypothetical protein